MKAECKSCLGLQEKPKKKRAAPKPKEAKAEKPAKKPKAEKPKKEPKAKAEKPAKKERKKKDPNAPKKNLSAFMYFSNAERPKVRTAQQQSDKQNLVFLSLQIL